MIKTVIFDMDGTVFRSYLDWQLIRQELDVGNESILEKIYSGPEPDKERLEILEKHEEFNTLKTMPIDGIKTFLSFLRDNDISPVLVTNNNQKNTSYLLDKFGIKFDDVITREMRLWKPGPDAFKHILETNKLFTTEVITIGDSHYDVLASDRAGLNSVYIIQPSTEIRDSILEKSGGVSIQISFFSNYSELTDVFRERLNLK